MIASSVRTVSVPWSGIVLTTKSDASSIDSPASFKSASTPRFGAPKTKVVKPVPLLLISSHISGSVSYTHLRAHETPEHLVCRLLLEKKKTKTYIYTLILLSKQQ